ncbi:MAG TPA: aminotransferase class V-fold PLP-dependent enzyme [Ktedonobacteraceae bacterium]|nr:aminotransferase class V-fold PLP-dependent enzyme [Ktedonobacteraceae bacterium]
MTDSRTILPPLDDMLSSLLLIEEGEHEFNAQEAGAQDIRQYFFPATRTNIYLNHAANGPLPRPVAQVMHEYIDDVSAFGGTHEPKWAEYERGAHRRLARLIHARSEQIAFTANTGDGLMMIAQGLRWQEGDAVISAEGEFPSNVYPWLNLQAQGVQVNTVTMRDQRIVAEDIFAHITERTRLVSLSLVQFATGYRNDIARIARYCHERGILCGIDAMQALGVLDIDVQALGVDFLAAASHKWLLGPRIIGILYVADGLLDRLQTPRRGWRSVETPFDYFNHQQQLRPGAARFEYGSTNLSAIVGLDAALGMFESIDGGMTTVEKRVLGLTAYASAGLARLGYPVVSPQEASERSGIVCFKPLAKDEHMTAQWVVDQLAHQHIYAAARGEVVRISPHFYNTYEDIDALLNVLAEMKEAAQTTQQM